MTAVAIKVLKLFVIVPDILQPRAQKIALEGCPQHFRGVWNINILGGRRNAQVQVDALGPPRQYVDAGARGAVQARNDIGHRLAVGIRLSFTDFADVQHPVTDLTVRHLGQANQLSEIRRVPVNARQVIGHRRKAFQLNGSWIVFGIHSMFPIHEKVSSAQRLRILSKPFSSK